MASSRCFGGVGAGRPPMAVPLRVQLGLTKSFWFDFSDTSEYEKSTGFCRNPNYPTGFKFNFKGLVFDYLSRQTGNPSRFCFFLGKVHFP